MIWGLLLGGRRYDRIDYGCALTVTFGCGLFVLTGSIAAPQLQAAGAAAASAASRLDLLATGGLASGGSSGDARPLLLYGLLLLGAFLLFDGLTSTTQVCAAALEGGEGLMVGACSFRLQCCSCTACHEGRSASFAQPPMG